jgi:hypothetical protein
MSDDGGDAALAKAKADLAVPQPGRNRVFAWLDVEWAQYADRKNADYREAQREAWDSDHWVTIVENYLGRALSFGLDTLQGRQAMMKSLAAHVDACAWMIQKYGEPPMPGHPSGEIVT